MSATLSTLTPTIGRRVRPVSPWRTSWSVFCRNRLALSGLVILLLIVAAACLAPVLPTLDPSTMNNRFPVQSPTWEHPLGTDSFGRDILSRVIWGARISLAVATGTILLGGSVGIAAGLIAGYTGGVIDVALMRLMDAIFTFPSILLAVALIGVLGTGQLNVVIALGVVYVPSFARQARAETRQVIQREFVQAAIALGVKPGRLLLRHVLPNIMGTLVVRGATFFAFTIIAESSLSFLGLGAQPPTPTWGGMLAEARPYITRNLWYPMVPGTVIVLVVLAINVIGDGLLDAINPRRP